MKLKYGDILSSLDLVFNMRRYTEAVTGEDEVIRAQRWGGAS